MDRSLSVSSFFIPKKGVCAEIMQQLYFLFMQLRQLFGVQQGAEKHPICESKNDLLAF